MQTEYWRHYESMSKKEVLEWFKQVGSIELDCKVYNKQKIIIRSKGGEILKVLEPPPYEVDKIMSELNKHWIETLKGE